MVKSKSTKIILFFIIIIFIFILISYLMIIFLNSSKRQIAYIYDDKVYNRDLIYPLHTYIISNSYEGEISIKTINKSINYFCATYVNELLSRFKQSSNQSEVLHYYNKNKSDIARVSGIREYNRFDELVKKICEIDVDELVLKRIEIEPDDADYDGLDFYCNIKSYYENDIEVRMQMVIADERINKNVSPIEYTIID